jgi:hypothetical protein
MLTTDIPVGCNQQNTEKNYTPEYSKAIVSLQRMYRLKNIAHFAKKELKLYNMDMTDYHFRIFGNEPWITVEADCKTADTKFNLISTGGMNTLLMLRELIAWDEVISSESTAIPKLFVIDYSDDALVFWKFIKKLMLSLNSLEELNVLLAKAKVKEFDAHYLKLSFYVPKKFDDRHQHEPQVIYTHILSGMKQLITSEQQFSLIKAVVIKSSIVGRDWRDAHLHAALAELIKGQRNYVYSSNIIECILQASEKYTIEHSQRDVEQFTQAVCNYNPVLSLYARTSLKKFKEIDGLLPNAHMYFISADPQIHLAHLRDKTLAPLTKADQVEYLKNEQSCCGSTANILKKWLKM